MDVITARKGYVDVNGAVLLGGVLALLATAGTSWGMAKDGCGSGDCVTCHSLTVKEAGDLLSFIGGTVKQVSDPPIKGLWQVEIEKDKQKALVYLDYGKKHLVSAPIYSLATRQPIAGGAPPAEAQKPKKIKQADIPLTNSLLMGNPAGKKRLIVFTDPDCPFCGKLHTELQKLVAADGEVAVYIKLFPLVKIHPQAYEKSRVILLGGTTMLDEAFAGKKLPTAPQAPASAVDETIALAGKLGVTGTPTMIFPDGTVVIGSRDAAELKKLLAGRKKKK
jgi:thiol:disulfide interchange protein DsbC